MYIQILVVFYKIFLESKKEQFVQQWLNDVPVDVINRERDDISGSTIRKHLTDYLCNNFPLRTKEEDVGESVIRKEMIKIGTDINFEQKLTEMYALELTLVGRPGEILVQPALGRPGEILVQPRRRRCKLVSILLAPNFIQTEKLKYFLVIYEFPSSMNQREKKKVEKCQNGELRTQKNNGRLITNWYRTNFFWTYYINYFSKYPLKHKISVMTGLIDGAVLLSDIYFHASNIEIINKNKNFVTIPYVKRLRENIVVLLKHCQGDTLYTVHKKLNRFIKREKDTQRIGKLSDTSIHESENTNLTSGNTKAIIPLLANMEFLIIMILIGLMLVFHIMKITIEKREIAEMFFMKRYFSSINLQKDTENLV
ncbi:hypothetical protein X777_08718, partial [Ooceraea biroi]